MIRQPRDAEKAGQSFGVRAARIYSNIFSPPSTFAMFGFIIAWKELPFWTGSMHAAIFGFLTSLMPILYIGYLYKTNKIDDVHISDLKERRIPYILGILGAGCAFFLVRSLESSEIFLNFIILNIAGLISLALINLRWLISAHVASITLITVFTGFAYSITAGLFLAPLVALTFYVRHYLKRHTVGEMVSGLLLGIVLVAALAVFGVFQ